MDHNEVGAFLRGRRDALRPEDVGLRTGSRRRAAGLRREEVAAFAGMSADYLARLERGTGSQPSRQMINAIARALRLSAGEREHLLVLSGHHPDERSDSTSHVSPGLMRILDSLTDTPAQVMGPLAETLAQNYAAIALFGDETRYQGLRRSAGYRWFLEPKARALYPPEDHDHHSRVQVSQLHAANARLGSQLTAPLVNHLKSHSPEFDRLWAANEVGLRFSREKSFVHPEVGVLALHCQIAVDPDQFQSLLVFTATPGSDNAEKLRLLSVVGSYNIAT